MGFAWLCSLSSLRAGPRCCPGALSGVPPRSPPRFPPLDSLVIPAVPSAFPWAEPGMEAPQLDSLVIPPVPSAAHSGLIPATRVFLERLEGGEDDGEAFVERRQRLLADPGTRRPRWGCKAHAKEKNKGKEGEGAARRPSKGDRSGANAKEDDNSEA